MVTIIRRIALYLLSFFVWGIVAYGDAQTPVSVEMDFRNADIRKVIGYVSEVTGRNFIVGPDVEGTISVVAPTQVPVDEVFGFFQSVLEVHGYTTVASGEMVKIVSSAEARARGVETMTGSESEQVSDKMITKVIHLNYLSPVDAKQILSPLVSENGEILAYPQTKTLIMIDPQSNIRRLEELLQALDVPGAEEEIWTE
jgi:general secretion pathway protein D